MSKTILAVDDSRSVREAIRFTLEPLGYDIEEAADGNEGFEKLEKHPVDLVITDSNMPKLDGIGLVSKVRDCARHAALPLVVLAAGAEADLMRAGKQAGASGWIVKPFNELQLELIVRKFIG